MSAELITVLSLLGLTVIALFLDKWRPSYVFAACALVLLVTGQIEVNSFLKGFANPSIISIFLLIILTSAINENFNIVKLFDRLFDSSKNSRQFLLRMGFSVAALSSVMNNTPIVAMMIPYVYQWGKKRKIAASKLLIPLSYATILGGMITVLGTSTNLVLIGFIQEENAPMLGVLDFLIPGLLVTFTGVIFIAIFGNKLLPNHKDIIEEATQNFKEYLVEVAIQPISTALNKTVQNAGLRNLDGIFLVEILRENKAISPVVPDEILMAGDRLFFAGEPEKVFDLVRIQHGFIIPAHSGLAIGNGMNILETVIPANSNLIGATLKEFEFREHFDAAVIAIHRNGEKLRGKIGEIRLDKGDLLLLSTGKTFLSKNKARNDLYLVSEVKQIKTSTSTKRRLFWPFAIGIIGASIFGVFPLFTALLMLLTLSFVFRLTNYEEMKKNFSLDLFIILGCAIAISNALIQSGAAAFIGELLSDFAGDQGPVFVLILIYLITVVLTQFITNAAAIAVVFPIGLALATHTNCDPRGVFVAMAFGASCCFLTPVGYQTNLMIYGPGNYQFKDFVKIGLPLTFLYSCVVISWILFQYS